MAGRCGREIPHVKPILTPRFLPSCTDELLEKLGDIQKQHHLPVQSHLSENRGEVAWVQELFPKSKHYGDAYDSFGLFGGENCPTIMAHCVLSSDDEIRLMKERGVFIAHCPESNTNLASGIAPARRYLTEGIPMGLGSDIAGGTRCSIFFAMAEAIRVSKLRWRLVDESLTPSPSLKCSIWQHWAAVPSLEKWGLLKQAMNLTLLCWMTAVMITRENMTLPSVWNVSFI